MASLIARMHHNCPRDHLVHCARDHLVLFKVDGATSLLCSSLLSPSPPPPLTDPLTMTGMGTSTKRSSCNDHYYTMGGRTIPGIKINGMNVLAVKQVSSPSSPTPLAGHRSHGGNESIVSFVTECASLLVKLLAPFAVALDVLCSLLLSFHGVPVSWSMGSCWGAC